MFNISQSQSTGKTVINLLPKTSQKYFDDILKPMLIEANDPVHPPQNLQEFEFRVNKLILECWERNCGLQHYLKDRTYIKTQPTLEDLIKIECDLERQRKKALLYIDLTTLSQYKFLKLALESNYPFSDRDQKCLGIFTDRSRVTKLQKRKIGVQAAAQVLWDEKGSSIPFINNMREEIWSHNTILSFLGLLNFQTGEPMHVDKRTIEDYIRQVCPIPEKKRQGWHNKSFKIDKSYYSEIVPIPGIFFFYPLRINFLKLRIAVIAIAKIQKFFGWSLEEIQASPILLTYKQSLKFYLKDYVNDWIEEGISDDGGILDV